MCVQHNIVSMNAYRNYNNNTSQINKNIEKLSSGYTINRAGDDAAGLAISEKMRAQITGLEGAQKNAKDGISLVQTAEGALTEVHSMLNRMYSLAEQSANGTYDENTDRAQLQKEVSSLRTEINRIADSANFNGLKLLDGSISRVNFDWETVSDELQSHISISLGDADTDDLDAFITDFLMNGLDAELTVNGETLTAGNGDKIAFTSMADVGADDRFNVTISDSAGHKSDIADALNADAELEFGDSGEAFAYDGDHSFNFHVTNTRGETVANLVYRFDRQTFTTTDSNDNVVPSGGGDFAIFILPPGDGLDLQIGDDANSWNIMNVSIGNIHAEYMGIANVDISEQGTAQLAMNALKDAINYVSDIRGGLGATQNRLEHTINNLSVMQENIQDAESTIRDTDVANEMMKYTKNSILVQSAQAMLAQANQQPQGILQLLQ